MEARETTGFMNPAWGVCPGSGAGWGWTRGIPRGRPRYSSAGPPHHTPTRNRCGGRPSFVWPESAKRRDHHVRKTKV
ncbi:hypothetical protein SMG44B_30249 [Stenotrophomonas maltophilia]